MMQDLISRQAAIDIVRKWFKKVGVNGDICLDGLRQLPSVQPELSTEIQEILDYLDTTLHPIVSPDNWYVYSELHDMVSRLPSAQHEPKWIPCSKRLPEETEARYWVCTDGGYQCQCRWTNDVFGLGEGDTWTWKIFDIPQYSKVIAWMPLPEPYAERRTDEGD